MNDLEKKSKELQKQYHKEWRKKNPDKIRENNRRYWERKAAAAITSEHINEYANAKRETERKEMLK